MLLIGKNVEAWFKVGQHKWSTGEDNQRKQTEWLDWGEFDCRDADAVCSTTQRTRPANSKTTAWLWDTGQSVSLRSIIHDTATCRRLMSDKMDQFSSLTEISQTDWSVIKSSRRRPNWKPVWPWRDTRSLSITVSRSSVVGLVHSSHQSTLLLMLRRHKHCHVVTNLHVTPPNSLGSPTFHTVSHTVVFSYQMSSQNYRKSST